MDDELELFLRITPQQAGVIVEAVNRTLPDEPFVVGPVIAGRTSPDANPVTVEIGTGWGIEFSAIPGGSIMRVAMPSYMTATPMSMSQALRRLEAEATRGAELRCWWDVLAGEFERLDCIEEPAAVTVAGVDGGPARDGTKPRPRRTNTDIQRDINEAGRLYYQEELKQDQIMERLGKSEPTIKRYLRKYRAQNKVKNRGQK